MSSIHHVNSISWQLRWSRLYTCVPTYARSRARLCIKIFCFFLRLGDIPESADIRETDRVARVRAHVHVCVCVCVCVCVYATWPAESDHILYVKFQSSFQFFFFYTSKFSLFLLVTFDCSGPFWRGRNISVSRPLDLRSEGRGFDSRQERRENFLLKSFLAVLTNAVSVPLHHLLPLSDHNHQDYFVAMVHAGNVCVSIIHRILAWITAPLTSVCDIFARV